MNRINEIFEAGGLFDGRYRLTGLLSTDGGSADVWLAVDVNTADDSTSEEDATRVVIKVYRPKNIIDIEGEYQFRSEFKKVFGCHHENIIQPTYFSIYEDMPYLVLPYCPSGSSGKLTGTLHKEADLWKYIFEVSSGLAYLHERTPRIVHQDIKPANVLIDDNGNYAITDFGISAAMGGADAASDDDTGGTLAYMAPERFTEGAAPMPESDIWALGATIYELITGDAPFGDDGGSRQRKDTPVPPIRNDVPESVKQLVYACLAYNPKDRPTARSIVDTVLKRRYSRGRKTIVMIAVAVVAAAAGLTLLITGRNTVAPEVHLDSLMGSADSITAVQARRIGDNDGTPSADNVPELKKAIVLLNKVIKDAPDSYAGKGHAVARVRDINRLISQIEDYAYVSRLVDNARITEMDDSVVKYSIVLDNHKLNINQSLKRLRCDSD